jgi:hypothetical protein
MSALQFGLRLGIHDGPRRPQFSQNYFGFQKGTLALICLAVAHWTASGNFAMTEPTPYPYPEIDSRDPTDVSAALGAFHRLYKHALATDNTAMAVFAAYKALQKAEDRLANNAIAVPAWVSEGMWLALENYLRHPLGRANKNRLAFSEEMKKFLREYNRWYKVSNQMALTNKKADPAMDDVAAPGAKKRALQDAYGLIRRYLDEANSREALSEEDGEPLPQITPRDLVPTRKLLRTLGKL